MIDPKNIEEFLDPLWRLNNLYPIVDKNANWTRFQENYVQSILNRSRSKNVMILKARQMGITTNQVLRSLDFAMFNSNVIATIIAHENDAIKKIFQIVRRTFKKMNPWLRPQLQGGGSMYELYFPKLESRIYCDLESRGDTISRLHVSEAAFIPFERIWATLQAVPKHGYVTFESTPNGVGNWFYDYWHDPTNGYEKFFFPWYLDPTYSIASQADDKKGIELTKEERDLVKYARSTYKIDLTKAQIRWRRTKKALDRDNKFAQEYPEDPETCFLLSGGAVIDRKLITEKIQNVSQPIFSDELITLWEKPILNHTYVIGADTSEGAENSDYCVATVIDCNTKTEVGQLRGRLPPFLYAKKLVELCKIFTRGVKYPLLAVERNNHGHAVLLELVEHEKYPNLFYYAKDKVGWNTDSITRPIIVDGLLDALRYDHVKINSKVTLAEANTLVSINGKIQAAVGCHDDCIMSTAIAVKMMVDYARGISAYDKPENAIITI